MLQSFNIVSKTDRIKMFFITNENNKNTLKNINGQIGLDKEALKAFVKRKLEKLKTENQEANFTVEYLTNDGLVSNPYLGRVISSLIKDPTTVSKNGSDSYIHHLQNKEIYGVKITQIK